MKLRKKMNDSRLFIENHEGETEVSQHFSNAQNWKLFFMNIYPPPRFYHCVTVCTLSQICPPIHSNCMYLYTPFKRLWKADIKHWGAQDNGNSDNSSKTSMWRALPLTGSRTHWVPDPKPPAFTPSCGLRPEPCPNYRGGGCQHACRITLPLTNTLSHLREAV